MHKRHKGESFIEYLERVERDLDEQVRVRRESCEELGGGKSPRRQSVQSDFWLVYRLMEQQNRRCFWCCRLLVGEKFHIDHVHPLARGGSNELENLRVSCTPCNLAKNASFPTDYALELLS